MRAAVVALGDLGRSARMRYHAHALAANGVDVDLVGLEGHAAAARDHRRSADHACIASTPSTLRSRGELTGFDLRGRRPARRVRV